MVEIVRSNRLEIHKVVVGILLVTMMIMIMMMMFAMKQLLGENHSWFGYF